MTEEDIDTSSGSTLSEDELQLLYRMDERTERMDKRMDAVMAKAHENDQAIDDLEGQVKRNSTILNGLGIGFGGLLTWAMSKLRIL